MHLFWWSYDGAWKSHDGVYFNLTLLSFSYILINFQSKSHPEKPERIKRILESLKEKRLYERCGNVEARLALDEELELTHDLNYVNSLKVLKSKTREELIALSKNPDSVYFHFDTFECAKLAAGSVLSIVDAVCNNKFTNGVAISRPPGHHANSNACSGFCFFNSIAVSLLR